MEERPRLALAFYFFPCTDRDQGWQDLPTRWMPVTFHVLHAGVASHFFCVLLHGVHLLVGDAAFDFDGLPDGFG